MHSPSKQSWTSKGTGSLQRLWLGSLSLSGKETGRCQKPLEIFIGWAGREPRLVFLLGMVSINNSVPSCYCSLGFSKTYRHLGFCSHLSLCRRKTSIVVEAILSCCNAFSSKSWWPCFFCEWEKGKFMKWLCGFLFTSNKSQANFFTPRYRFLRL